MRTQKNKYRSGSGAEDHATTPTQQNL